VAGEAPPPHGSLFRGSCRRSRLRVPSAALSRQAPTSPQAPSSEGLPTPPRLSLQRGCPPSPPRLPLQRELSAQPTEGAARRPLPAGVIPPTRVNLARPGRQPIPKPPLCKGRWLAFRRDGRIVPSLSAQATHSFVYLAVPLRATGWGSAPHTCGSSFDAKEEPENSDTLSLVKSL